MGSRRRFTCRRKRRYDTREEALAVIEVMPRDNRWARLNAYRCGEHWHVGHRPAKIEPGVYR